MNMTNDNKLPVEVATMQPQAPPPPNEVFIRVGTTLYKVVDQPTINGGKVRKRIPWNMETLRQDYGKEFIKYVHKYDGFCTVPEHVNHRTVIDGFLNLLFITPNRDGILVYILDTAGRNIQALDVYLSASKHGSNLIQDTAKSSGRYWTTFPFL